MTSSAEAAIRAGIPVVIIDSGLESKAIVSYVATNNYHGGVLAAQRIVMVDGRILPQSIALSPVAAKTLELIGATP